MKKIIALVVMIAMVISLASCGKKDTVTDTKDEIISNDISETVDVTDDTEKEDDTQKEPETAPETKPQANPQTKPEAKPEAQPQTKPEAKPEVNTPQPEQPKTLGGILKADFINKAPSHSSALSLAEALVSNSSIQFAGMATEVTEGYLTGFNDKEIKGFSQGAMFAPMIGTIPFVGYVFILENEADVSSFTAELTRNANLRWNLCTEAEEMITASSKNKVFFVMCPKSME